MHAAAECQECSPRQTGHAVSTVGRAEKNFPSGGGGWGLEKAPAQGSGNRALGPWANVFWFQWAHAGPDSGKGDGGLQHQLNKACQGPGVRGKAPSSTAQGCTELLRVLDSGSVIQGPVRLHEGWQQPVSGHVAGGLACRLGCIVLVCSWRRQLADRQLLPFPWTLSVHRRWCPSASHPPVSFLFLFALSFPLYFPWPFPP